ncbi:gliding motility-associated C-terminal domain-containing protein [Flavobacterium sp. HXWNR69]|uniref:Gliding motility-associated C-terminal domain-containing protein n=1 Tax=Flavobacterium fragile TaxID=2949085 RepID=A0ABT0THX9_9FLAO|nr:gliding motility-associated C-terminal domain-containing protein [Flavobacterium sp. HXWNR69]MCL9770587.1 gliding motility-associated C-terminal domain-containing protein [Flavobacterium sp. HXWNR69]
MTLLLLPFISISQTFYINQPTIGFTQACASSSFNSFNFSFSFYPVQNLGINNEFIVELSDANGSFSNPTIVKTLTNRTSPVSSNFNLPNNTYGENYRIRVRSTSPVKISNPSNLFPAYYAIHNQPYSINSNAGMVFLCSGETYQLSIDNTGNSNSPLFYPNLTYKWYKDYVEIVGENGPTIIINEPGSYYSIVDYGSCMMNSYSNIVQFQYDPELTPQISASNTVLCPNQTVVLTSNIQSANYIYKWYKDNNEIINASGSSFTATSEGVYHLSIGSNGCFYDSNFITLDDYDFSITIDNPSPLIILPGQSETLTSQNTALSPQLQWNLNGNPISGATNSNLVINNIGNYTISASETTPCAITNSASISVTYPNSFEAIIAASSNYSPCQSNLTTISLSSFETTIDNTIIDLLSSSSIYSLQWYKDDLPVSGANQSSLTLNNATENGVYKLAISYPNLTTIYSNEITIGLNIGNVLISKDRELCLGSNVILSSSIVDSSYSYQWYIDGNAITGATNSTYTASIEGNYQLTIFSGTCSVNSNVLPLEIDQITIISHSNTNLTLIPGQAEILQIATTATNPQYSWYVNDVLINNATEATLSVISPGTYKVIVSENTSCYNEVELIFNVIYPTDFTVTIESLNYNTCQNTPITLTIESITTDINGNNTTIPNNSSFVYQWFKDNVQIANANSNSYTIANASENGNYHLSVQIPDLGTRESNNIGVELSSFNSLVITPNGTLCNTTSQVTILSSITDSTYNYQWFLNNQTITGANSPSLIANAEGIYSLIITFGNCSITSNPIALTLGVLDVISSSNSSNTIIPGESANLFINTNAVNPTYIWYFNNIIDPSLTSNSILVNTPGNYKVRVIQADECNTEIEMAFLVEYPSDFTATIAIENPYTSCQNNPVTLRLDNLSTIINSNLISIPSSSNFSYQWLKNGVAVAGANSEFLILNSDTENGNYQLQVTIPGIGAEISNAITITLFTTSTPIITSSNSLCPNSNVTLTSSVNNPNYNYKWYLNGNEISGAETPNLNTLNEGVYTVKISQGNCEISSAPFTLTLYDFTITPLTALQDYLLPGGTKNLSVATTALNGQIYWYRNNILLSGENSLTYTATETGLYKVVIEQTQNCIFSKEVSFELVYPNSIVATISTDNNYQSCSSTSTTLNINSFMAFSPFGDFNLLGNSLGYTYQWLKNGVPIPDGNTIQLILNQYNQNGNYSLQITMPGFGSIITNSVDILFPAITDLNISADGMLCSSNSTVTLSSNFNEASANYEWYSTNNSAIIGNGQTLQVTQAGSYYLVVNYENCSFTSNTIAINQLDENIINVNQNNNISINEGESILIEANNADSYSWEYDNNIISTSNSILVSQGGIYTLHATVENCTISKIFIVTVIENNVESIPNIVSPNNDNLNDLWKLPSRYLNENVEITIYDNTGKKVMQTRSYQNNWPTETDVISNKNIVYYYTITENSSTIKKGTITVIR